MTTAELWQPAAGAGARLHVHDGGRFVAVSADEWAALAEGKAGALRAVGVAPGARVGCVLTNSLDVCATVFGIWYAGATVVSLPTLARGMDPGAYVRQLARLCGHAEVELLLVEEQFRAMLVELLPPDAAVAVRSFESLDGPGRLAPAPPADDECAFVQYSSGSTREPKGCMLTPRAIAAHMRQLGDVLDVDGVDDRGVSWLPLSHDMGLFGCLLLSWSRGMSLALSSPQRFLSSPATWLSDCAEFRSTITAGPNFALELVARAARAVAPAPFPMRRWVIGGERIDWGTLRRVAAALEPAGVPLRAFNPAYGLAEATLAVTMVRNDEEPRARSIPMSEVVGALADGDGAAPGDGDRPVPVVNVGRPLDGVAVEVDPAGGVGEIVVRSQSLAAGYVGNPTLTRERFRDGGVRTGDFGFVDDSGELYVVGRFDDMISVGGRKVYARDLESALGDEAGVRPGSCVLVDAGGADGRARLVVLAEPARGFGDHEAIAATLRAQARAQLGVNVDECVVVPPGTIPKTPSGKVQRYRCRELVQAHGAQPLGKSS